MSSLNSGLRSALERAVVEARENAEGAAHAALAVLAVNDPRAFTTLTSEQRTLRNVLRAKARQLGSGSQSTGFALLVEEVAYVHWHRMLFARFLAENNLLMHPMGVPVTLEECEELADEEGDQDRWATAARYASNMLPGIFSPDEPSIQMRFAPEGLASLEAILNSLPSQVFTSDDGLGWVYQFWQSKKKKEVSDSERKIEKLDLAAYSQLFTEDYMVRFLLENSLGAWWAARHPDSPLVNGFKFLRFREDGTPAAGTFLGWPERIADITVMDPCCGSGHFLVVAFEMLRRMRMEKEGLEETEAAEAVLRDNLFGLEIDPRCVQIAAFALALAAWKVGGYRELPPLNIACSGIPVSGQPEAWTKLASGDDNMKRTLERLHGLFVNAPDLGSLISPADVQDDERMFTPEFESVAPLFHDALSRERVDDPVGAVFGSTALGAARAAELLVRQYTLVATNVPYLARGKQGDVLRDFIERRHGEAKADLATAFLERCRSFCLQGGSYAVVTPQTWLFLKSYAKLRQTMLREQNWHIVARLGSSAFETIGGVVVNVALIIVSNSMTSASTIAGINASQGVGIHEKALMLATGCVSRVSQTSQTHNPDARITLDSYGAKDLLSSYAKSLQGISPADLAHFGRLFWEMSDLDGWELWAGSPEQTSLFGGRSRVLWWNRLEEALQAGSAYVRGTQAWGRKGVTVRQTGTLPVTLYTGDKFDTNVAVILPNRLEHLPAIWAFCSSPEFNTAVRHIDTQLKVTNASLAKVPFDLEHWQTVAEERSLISLPEPCSDSPTQWLFQGDPPNATDPLQVAVIRLLGYQWPLQGSAKISHLAVPDGILPLAYLVGQEPAAERLRRVLSVAHGADWSAGQQMQLLRQVGFETKGLDVWLRDGFFKQHCELFYKRPFIWHIWDGRRDGFAVLVNYHMLDAANLDKLIYTYLGEWIRTQRAAEESGTPGANARLVAALELQRKLEAIRDGEPPYDIYVRWKPVHEQPIGWNPDLNDGVRLNIRPFVAAGVLRNRVNVGWKKDRGRNLDGSERLNDIHLRLAEKRAAREAETE